MSAEYCSHGALMQTHAFCPIPGKDDTCGHLTASGATCGADPDCHYAAFTGTRESLLARVSDVLRRSGVEDAEQLIRALECDTAAFRDALETAWGVIANVDSGNLLNQSEAWREASRRWHNETFLPTRAGREIGPPKPASERAE